MDKALDILKGTAQDLEVYSDKVVIVSKGTLGKMSQRGNKAIFFNDISGIQCKPGTFAAAGYVQFTLHGGREKSGSVLAAARNENTVLYHKKENASAERVVGLIEELRKKQSGSVSEISNADEIMKYKHLLDEGIITNEEFDKKKAELLGL